MLLVDHNVIQNTERHKTESQENLSLQEAEQFFENVLS